MFCNYCRALNPNDAVYCSACGRTIKPPDETQKEETEPKSRSNELLPPPAAPPSKPTEEELPGTTAAPSTNDTSANRSFTPLSIPASSPVLSGEESPAWNYQEMGGEELEQLREAYEKLRVSHPKLRSELERRASVNRTVDSGVPQDLDSPIRDTPLDGTPQERLDTGDEHGVSRGAADQFLDKIPTNLSLGATSDRVQSETLQPDTLPSPEYSSMGRRFVAYFADVVLIYLILISVYFASGLFGWKLSGEEPEINLLYFAALFTYMIVAQTAYHTTIGKYIQALEVRSENPERPYPSFGRILLRETLGRVFSSFFFGAGYWTADRTKRNQAWSDRLAGTVVSRRTTNPILVRAFTVFVIISFIADVGIIGFGYYKLDWDKRYAALEQEMGTATKEVIAARDAVDRRLNSAPTVVTWDDFSRWQEIMGALKDDLDAWETKIDHMQRLIQKGISEDLAASRAERNQLVILSQVYDIRKKQAEKYRQESDLVVRCERRQRAVDSLRNDLKLLDSDISSMNTQASQLLAEIGVK